MATSNIAPSYDFNVGDVLLAGSNSSYGTKIVARPFIEALGEYRWIVQDVNIVNSKAVPDGNGQFLAVYTSRNLRESYKYLWTPEKFEMQKGALFKDQGGNFYIAESDTKLWSLNSGTWSTVTSFETEGWVELNGGKPARLERVKTVIGHDMSKALKLS